MTTPSALTNPNFCFLIPGTSTSGYFVIPCIPGGSVTQYKTTWTDSTAGTANPNKIALDANGEAPVWGTGFYKMYVTTPGGTTVYSVDNWSAQGSITGGVLEFVPQSNAFTYVATNQFSMVGDGTLTFQVNRRVKADVTAGTIYGSITVSAYAAGITTVTVLWDAGSLDSGLSTVYVGIISVTNQSLPINGITMNITGTASNLSAKPVPWTNVTGVTSALYSFSTNGTGCALTYTVSGGAINSVTAVAAAGSGYKAGDVLTVNTGGKNSYIRVLTISGSGVATVEILYGGTGYAGAVGAATVPATVNFNTLTLAGVLTQNITILMPYNNPLEWAVANNTTGAFTVTVKVSNSSDAAIGTGVPLTQGSGNSTITKIYTDGTTDVWYSFGIAGQSTNVGGGGANQIPYQTGQGATSFITPVNSALLVTSAGGVPSESVNVPVGVATLFQANTASSQGADLALTAASNPAQIVTMTSAGWSVVLPDATTMNIKAAFLIINAGSYVFCVRDFNHKLLAVLNPSSGTTYATRQQCMVTLTNNSTQSGVWWVSNTSEFSALNPYFAGPSTAINAAVALTPVVVNLDATHFIAIYGSASLLKAVVGTVAGETITYGTETTIGGANNPLSGSISACLLQANSVLVTYSVVNALYAVLLNISGATITPNTGAGNNSNLYSGSSAFTGVCTMSAALGAVIYDLVTSSYPVVNTLTIGGSGSTQTITLGTPTAAIFSVATTVGIALAPISGSSVMAITHDATNILQAVVISALTSSGGTVNSKTQVYSSASTQQFGVAALSASSFVVASNSATPQVVVTLLTISGTTITKAVQTTPFYQTTLAQVANTSGPTSVVALTATKALILFQNSSGTHGLSTGLTSVLLDTNGTSTLTAEYYPTGQTGQATFGTGMDNTFYSIVSAGFNAGGAYTPGPQALCTMSANQAVAVFPGASGYVNAVTVETVLP